MNASHMESEKDFSKIGILDKVASTYDRVSA